MEKKVPSQMSCQMNCENHGYFYILLFHFKIYKIHIVWYVVKDE